MRVEFVGEYDGARIILEADSREDLQWLINETWPAADIVLPKESVSEPSIIPAAELHLLDRTVAGVAYKALCGFVGTDFRHTATERHVTCASCRDRLAALKGA